MMVAGSQLAACAERHPPAAHHSCARGRRTRTRTRARWCTRVAHPGAPARDPPWPRRLCSPWHWALGGTASTVAQPPAQPAAPAPPPALPPRRLAAAAPAAATARAEALTPPGQALQGAATRQGQQGWGSLAAALNGRARHPRALAQGSCAKGAARPPVRNTRPHEAARKPCTASSKRWCR